MRKLSFNLKFISILLASIVIFAVFLVAFYLYVLPKIMTSKFATNSIEKLTHDILKMELVIDNPKIKTSLKPLIECSVDSLLLTKNNEVLVSLDGFSTSISYNKIFQKEIKLNYLKANSLIVMADKLIENLPVFEKKENQKPSDFRLNIYNSEINLNELEVSYKQNKALIDLYSRDISIVEGENCKNLVFNLMIDVYKNTNNYLHIVSSSTNEVKIYEDKIKTDDLRVLLNKSDLLVNSEFKLEDLSLNLNAKSRSFFLKDIFNIINSDVVILDGEKLLSPLTNPSGYVTFDVNMKNNSDLSGVINITNAKASIKDLSNLPLNIQKGKIIVYKDKITYQDETWPLEANDNDEAYYDYQNISLKVFPENSSTSDCSYTLNVDSDGDGVCNYNCDTNGNGVLDGSETSTINNSYRSCTDYKYVKIDIPAITGSDDNIIDDIEIFYIGLK